MAASKRTARKARAKSTKKLPAKAKIDLQAMLGKKLSKQPVGKALAAIDLLYQELEDMEMRLEILISRIEILKRRTEILRKGETISLTTTLGALIGDDSIIFRPASSISDTNEPTADEKTLEWTKIKLLNETTINDVLLASETILSLESRAAESLIEKNVAEAVEDAEEHEKEKSEKIAEDAK